MDDRVPHPHDWLLLILAISCAALAILFVFLGAYVLEGIFTSADQAIREWTMRSRVDAIVRASAIISFVGDKGPLAILCVLVGWKLFPGRRWWVPLVVLCALGAGTFVDWLKATYGVIRPETGRLTSSSHSFPSGHASGTAAIALFFAYVAIRNGVRPALFTAAAVALTTLVGLSRVYLDEHWASDVVGGWIVGAAIATAFGSVYEWILRHQRLTAAKRMVPSEAGITRS